MCDLALSMSVVVTGSKGTGRLPLRTTSAQRHLTGGSTFRGQGNPLFLPVVVHDLGLSS